MRKQVRDQIVELLSTIGEGVKETVSLSPRVAESVLADCRQAVQIVERTLQDGLTREAFSKYECSLTSLKMYLKEMNAGIVQGVLPAERMQKVKFLLKGLRKRLLREAEVKLEIVFMPYKASMWDSLESVWKAANDDPGCDAYVMPIPYYDRNPDHSFSEFHYEGMEYPDYVPIVHYGDYSLEKRRPDIIFIHNSYDNCNYVTSIHPAFYASELKKYTEMLVYIPYFVLIEIELDNKKEIEKMSNFCYTPGIIYADRVIVQSEKMRYIYINEFRKIAKKNGLLFAQKELETKFLGLGSPKFDKVVSVDKEKYEIPLVWRKFIDKPDGTKKKVVMYNNSIGAFLKYGNEVLEKMDKIFQVFHKNVDNIVLWWRPHPLISTTIRSMRPDLWMQYSKIVERYRRESWGIYDDTADLDRAIAISDAYYGDGSSLVRLFQAVEKPVMIIRYKRDT